MAEYKNDMEFQWAFLFICRVATDFSWGLNTVLQLSLSDQVKKGSSEVWVTLALCDVTDVTWRVINHVIIHMHHCATLVALPENEVKGLLHAVVREIVQLKVIAYIFFLEDNTNFIIPYYHYKY